MNRPRFLLILAVALWVGGCRTYAPHTAFDANTSPPPPDYARLDAWAAHPDKTDPADRTPCPDIRDEQGSAAVDVFFLYPTSFLGARRGDDHWNAAMDDAHINEGTDGSSILYQASIFNGAGRVFAPRYRQAHYEVFVTKDKKSAAQALDLAYVDVQAAFDYYLKHWNKGRPFIIAGHSQGARHAMLLLRDRIQGTALQKQLVAAYIVGWPVRTDFFQGIPPCQSPGETGCFCSWRTWRRDYGLKNFPAVDSAVVCTNPLLWTTTSGTYAPKSANRGGVLRNFCQVLPAVTDAEVRGGVLLCTKPKFPGSFLFRRKNYHIADLNLYYFNVRENARERARAFQAGKGG